jgi:hypothetical protein
VASTLTTTATGKIGLKKVYDIFINNFIIGSASRCVEHFRSLFLALLFLIREVYILGMYELYCIQVEVCIIQINCTGSDSITGIVLAFSFNLF